MLSINRGTRVVALLAAGALSVLVAFPVAARDIIHSTSRGQAAEAVWGDVDVETGAGSYGSVVAFTQDGFGGLFLHEQHAALVACGEYAALAGTFRFGETLEPISIDIARNLGTAAASGTMTVFSGSFDECTGAWEVTSEEEVTVSMSLVASGGRDAWMDRYVEEVQHEFRALQINRMQSRAAIGTVLLDGDPIAFDAALISTTSSSTHVHIH